MPDIPGYILKSPFYLFLEWMLSFWTIIFGTMFVSAFFFPDTLREGLTVLGEMDKEIKYMMGAVITTAFGVEVYKKVKK